MATGRFKDVDWNLAGNDGKIATWERVQIAVLMDIRDELKRLNSLLHCSNFIEIPRTLHSIRKNTANKRVKKKATK